jgi:osmotically-inducible protein OsmY
MTPRSGVGAKGWTGVAGLLGALLFAAPALASDADLQRRVEERLAKAGLEQRGNVQVSVREGVVTLDGFTLTVDARRDAERAASKVSKRVESRLVVRPEGPRPDDRVRRAVADAILDEPRYGVFDSVGIAVDDGVVLLRGSVREPWLKDALDRRVAEVSGVREIRNDIRVAPASIADDRLRAELYRRIYGDDMFVRYSNWNSPPIRIIVENGRVSLTGVVDSEVEQVRLGMIARGTVAFKVDNHVEVEGQRPKEPTRTPTQS